MSDHDRGAYSPQTDAPLAFDARQSRGGGGFPTTLVISLIVLVVLVVAIVLFYRSGIRGAGEGPGPVGAPVNQIKSPPPASAQPSDQATGLQIYKSETTPAASSAPPAAFAPPPEQPAPRPAAAAHPVAPVTTQALPPAPAATQAPPPATKPAATIQAASPAAAPPAAKPAQAPKDEIGALLDKSAQTAPAKQAAPAKAVPAPAAAKPVVKPTATTASTAPAAGTSAQIGAYSSEDLVVSGWNGLATSFASDMTGKGQHFEPVKTADGKTLYRAAVTGFGSHAAAVAFCTKLKAANHACIVR